MSAASKHDYPALFQEYDQRLAGGESPKEIRATFESRGIVWGTFQNRRLQAKKAHQSTPEERQDTPTAHPSTPEEPEGWTAHPGTPDKTDDAEAYQSTPEEHPGTLEGYQEVMEDVQQSAPETPHVGTDEVHQSTPELTDSDEVHPSTPKVHQKLSVSDSSTAHPGVLARQEHDISTLMVHPGTPTSEDWEVWTTIKARWGAVEKMLADRQAPLSTPSTPGNTQKKTYVFDVRHIALIKAYAQEHRLELKDVVYMMCEQFFQGKAY
jgi:hypothetical protein